MQTLAPSPQARAQLILADERNLLGSSPAGLLDAIGEVNDIIQELLAENKKDTSSSIARANNMTLIVLLFELSARLRAALKELLADNPGQDDQVDKDDAGNIRIGGITMRKITNDDEAFEDLPAQKPKAPGKR